MQLELDFTSSPVVTVTLEEWRTVAGFIRHECSNLGRFRNKATGKLCSGTKAHNGYIHIGLSRDGKQVPKLAHRLIAETWLEQLTSQHCVVNHDNKNRADNRVSNLEWVTRSQNAIHAKKL